MGPLCFNCSKPGHAVAECKEPLNQDRIEQNKAAYLDARQPRFTGRYHLEAEADIQLSKIKPGRVSGELRAALGPAGTDPLVARMRKLGYPPAWKESSYHPDFPGVPISQAPAAIRRLELTDYPSSVATLLNYAPSGYPPSSTSYPPGAHPSYSAPSSPAHMYPPSGGYGYPSYSHYSPSYPPSSYSPYGSHHSTPTYSYSSSPYDNAGPPQYSYPQSQSPSYPPPASYGSHYYSSDPHPESSRKRRREDDYYSGSSDQWRSGTGSGGAGWGSAGAGTGSGAGAGGGGGWGHERDDERRGRIDGAPAGGAGWGSVRPSSGSSQDSRRPWDIAMERARQAERDIFSGRGERERGRDRVVHQSSHSSVICLDDDDMHLSS
eukprot:GILI01018666.1.p1 GENE.GILI01018666.1~~GILI01018666.1.p1  ORF type:complete len:398 (-),score=43.85 GILI01018666.1:77-1210(-)